MITSEANVATSATTDATKKSNGRQKRTQTHDRHKRFVKWIINTFPHVASTNSKHILDVASGKGETAARFSMCHKIPCVMVEPRLADVEACYKSKVLSKLPLRWQSSIKLHQQENPDFIADTIASFVTQLCMCFTDETVANDDVLQEALKKSSLLIGLHADNATEAIVKAALDYKIPFVVVPCCVFGSFFPDRRLHNGKHVNTYQEFCQYLLEKDSRFRKETLPFPGRNIAIFWDGND